MVNRVEAQSDVLKHAGHPHGLTRHDLLQWFRSGRERSKHVFAIPRPEMYYSRPIPLRNPIVFYEGHLPAFAVNTLMRVALEQPGVNEQYEILFARGIDPDSEDAAKPPTDLWPSRAEVQAYGAAAESTVARALAEMPLDQPLRIEAAIAILEHEPMHQETLLYMFHNMPHEQKVKRPPLNPARTGNRQPAPGNSFVKIPSGMATLGAERDDIGFGWDNEFRRHEIDVDAFEIQRHNVTNSEYLDFMNATGAPPPHFWLQVDGEWFWRGMFELIPLPLDWPVYVTYDEAEAYARWLGARVPSEGEYHRAAFGTPRGEERLYPWGHERPDSTRGNFDFANWDPVPVGSYPAGASAWGVHDLVGNGWEWTSTKFAGFPGFEPMPSYRNYSVDFFDGEHHVLKGASPATARDLIRRSFRNWFRPNYPYLYATFRCVR
jgi:formylglycine-generating enzyme required for sulfatase activity